MTNDFSDASNAVDPHWNERRWDAIVVGGGVMGLSCAWILAEQGDAVLLLEQNVVGSGASRAAAGMLAPYAEIEFHEDDLLRFAEASQRLWPAFAQQLGERSGIDVEFDDSGTILVSLDPDSTAELSRHFEYQRERGAPVEWLSADACREREPLLSPYLSAGVYSPHDYQVSNRRTVEALETIARQRGVTIVEHRRVQCVDAVAGEVSGVTLADGTSIRAARLVVTGGAWTSLIGGLDRLQKMFRPVKGQMLSLAAPEDSRLTHVVRGPGTYLVPKADGSLVVGGTVEERGFDTDITAGGLFEMLRGAYELLPACYEFPVKETWVGFRPGSRDNAPYLGETAIRGLFVAAGHYRNGIQQLAGTYEAMKAALAGQPLPKWAAPLSCSRLERN